MPLAIAGSLIYAGLGGAASHVLISKAAEVSSGGRGSKVAAVAGGVFCGVVALYSSLRAKPQEAPPTKVETPAHQGKALALDATRTI